MLYKVTKSIF